MSTYRFHGFTETSGAQAFVGRMAAQRGGGEERRGRR